MVDFLVDHSTPLSTGGHSEKGDCYKHDLQIRLKLENALCFAGNDFAPNWYVECLSDLEKGIPVLVKDGVGVLGMKSMGDPLHSREQHGHSDRVPALRDESSH